jgi:hypothetical protein
MKLNNELISKVAFKHNIEAACIKAVIKTEAYYDKKAKRNSGFYLNGKYEGELVIAFEGKVFNDFTRSKYLKTHPTICFTSWKTNLKYNKGLNEFDRLLEAIKLDREAAQKSCSWGLFQIMGYNYELCGYSSVVEMLEDFYKRGEVAHLEAFITYCSNRNILKYLRTLEFNKFALAYNGKGYKANKYDIKLKQYREEYLNNNTWYE